MEGLVKPIDREDKDAGFAQGGGLRAGRQAAAHRNPLATPARTTRTPRSRWPICGRRFGVETSFVNADINTHFALLQNGGDYDVARAGWIGDYSDAQSFLFLAESGNKGLNYSRYANPDFDALMGKASRERDPTARAKILAAAETILMRDQPIMPLMFYSSKNLISPKLKGWESNILDRHPARYLSIEP